MIPLADSLYLPEDVRAMDAHAIGVLGIAGRDLMEAAGAEAFRALRERWPAARRLAVVCGIGNNAGDGYVLARLARSAGLEARVLQLGDGARLKGDALAAAQAYRVAGGQAERFRADLVETADVVVDAIFGTGLDRPVQGEWATAIDVLARGRSPVLALDIPSGLHGGTGQVLATAVRAELTVTFIALKAGLFTGAGPAHVGQVILADLGLPPSLATRFPPCARLLRSAGLAQWLPPRPRDAHKGRYGHVLVVGGERGMAGAARLAAEAAARTGAGLVSVATRARHASALLAGRPELMVHGVETPQALAPLLEQASVVAVGPGLGKGAWGRSLLAQVLAFDGPLVMDADALNLLSETPQRRGDWILTPHPGEAGRLLQTPAHRVQEDRWTVVEQLLIHYGGTVVLKGAGTIVAAEAATPWLCAAGNPGMASGGMGDVLTGTIAGLLAQGLAPLEAAAAGVQLHAAAADAAAADGERGLLASDLMPWLRRLANP